MYAVSHEGGAYGRGSTRMEALLDTLRLFSGDFPLPARWLVQAESEMRLVEGDARPGRRPFHNSTLVRRARVVMRKRALHMGGISGEYVVRHDGATYRFHHYEDARMYAQAVGFWALRHHEGEQPGRLESYASTALRRPLLVPLRGATEPTRDDRGWLTVPADSAGYLRIEGPPIEEQVWSHSLKRWTCRGACGSCPPR